jgi:D-alanyl-D-alanine carboxypeptidase
MPTFADYIDTVSGDNEFQTRLSDAKDAYRKQFGKDMPITSGFRNRAEQEKLFAERSKNPNMVAAPGTSKHETNEAADIPASVPESFLNQYGIHRPLGSKDPVHAVLMPSKNPEGKTFADYIDSLNVGEKEKPKEESTKVKSLVGKILGTGLEMRQQVPGFLASAADVVASAPSAIASTIGYGAGRLFGLSPEQATEASQKVGGALAEPVGRLTGLNQTAGYRQALPTQVMEYIGKNIGEGAQSIAQKFGVPAADVENAINAAMMAGGAAAPKVVRGLKTAAAELAPAAPSAAPSTTVAKPGMVSAGAAVVPDATTIKQALSVATPELQQTISSIPVNEVNIPTLQRHIEADTLPVPVRLTEGQATGDVVKLSNEQNRRGKDPVLAQRFNEQNGQLVENLGLIRDKAAPDVYGTKKIENSQGIIDAYKDLDNKLNTGITADYQALRDAAGGQFPVDAPKLLQNVETKLKKELLSNEAPSGQFSELKRLAENNSMTFEDYLSLRRNLGDIARTSQDGSVRKAAGYMIEELEKLPLQKEAAALKPLADKARASARARFQMLEKDPAMKAAVDDAVPADKFIDKFVVNGVNKNINTMVQNLGVDSPAHQHMAAGTINWLTDKAGIVDGNGNFSQAGYNKALKKLDDVQNLNAIFNQEAASQLKTLGNVARYTQAQPRGAFVNNSNTLVGSLAEKAGKGVSMGVEKGLNVAVPGLQLGTTVMEMRARRAAEAETRKALEVGAGTRQKGQNKLSDLGK